MARVPTWRSVWTGMTNRRRMRVPVAVVVATVPALLVWSAFEGPGWLGDGRSYAFVSLSALVSLVAACAAVLLALIQSMAEEPFGLFTGRRPAPVSALWLVAMLAAGLAVCGLMATQQGDTAWEPSDRGWFVGWVVHLVLIGGLLVLLWWLGARSVWILSAPVVTGLLAFLLSAPGGWAEEDADFRDDATFADGLGDVLPYTLVAALLMGLAVAPALVRGLSSGDRRTPPGGRAGLGAHDG